jgi:hypothetical protein
MVYVGLYLIVKITYAYPPWGDISIFSLVLPWLHAKDVENVSVGAKLLGLLATIGEPPLWRSQESLSLILYPQIYSWGYC